MNDPQWLETDKRLTQKGEDYGVGNSLVKALKRAHAHVEELRAELEGLVMCSDQRSVHEDDGGGCNNCGRVCTDACSGVSGVRGACLLTRPTPPGE